MPVRLAGVYDATATRTSSCGSRSKAGLALVGAAFVKEPVLAEGVFQPRPPLASFEYAGKSDTDPAIDSDRDSRALRRRARPRRARAAAGSSSAIPRQPSDEAACARADPATLARRAYRRPVTAGRRQARCWALSSAAAATAASTAGIQWTLERLLVDPDFLFRIEREPAGASAGAPYRLSDLDLASRLSFFLWSSIPDDELLDAGDRGRLQRAARARAAGPPDARRRRVDGARRRTSPGSGSSAQHADARARPEHLPDFDDNLREAFQRETELFLESQLREDRSVVDLLTANYTFVNERLARHYGIPTSTAATSGA